MPALELPHTNGCLVCGRTNPHGLKLRLHVLPESGLVSTEFVPRLEHIGFEGIVHGGVLAAVADEAMVWASTWRVKRFCIAGEFTVRFRQPLTPNDPVRVEASVEFSRPKLVEAVCKVFDFAGKLIATGSGKYVPVAPEQHLLFIKTFLDEPNTAEAAAILKGTTAPAPVTAPEPGPTQVQETTT